MQFNNNECVCNTLLKSLNDLVSTMLNLNQANTLRQQATDSGYIYSSSLGEMNSNTQSPFSSNIVFALVIMALVGYLLRSRNDGNNVRQQQILQQNRRSTLQ